LKPLLITMNKPARLLLCALALLSLNACALVAFVPKLGMGERRWVNRAYSSDLVYIDGDVKAYRYSGSYYYFKAGRLAKVTPTLVSADQVEEFQKK
jgi:hypothetical protein